MKLNKKIKDDIKFLVKLEEKIYKVYVGIESGLDLDTNINNIFALLDREQKLIKKINLNSEKMREIKRYFEGKLRINLDEDLIKLSLIINENMYPYFRTYVRLYYSYCRKETYESTDSKSLFIDQEVLNLYRLLHNLALEEDSLEIDFYSKIILLNSPFAEEEILKNAFLPVTAYDAVEYASEIYTAMEMAIQRNKGTKISVNYDRIKNATLSRKLEFDKIFHELLVLLLNNLPKYLKGDMHFKMISCYFESIFVLLDEESREYVYKSIDNSKVLNNPEFNSYGFLEEFLPNLETRIKEDLLPYNKHLSLFNF